MSHFRIKSDRILMENFNKDYSDIVFRKIHYILQTETFQGHYINLPLLDGFSVKILDINIKKLLHGASKIFTPHIIEFGFVISGFVNVGIKGSRRDYDMFAGQNYLRRMSGDFLLNMDHYPDQRVQIIDIRFTPESFERFCHQHDFVLPSAFRKPCFEDKQSLYDCPSVVTPEMTILIKQIFTHSLINEPNQLFLESQCSDLVLLYLDLFRRKSNANTSSLASKDIESIREARHILSQRIETPPSLMELARLTNLNDFKLKRGFRQAFGSTVYGYLKELRLQRAQNLMREQNKSVTETALSVGYKNIGDFGIAFKNRFGLTPRNFIKS